MVKLEKKPQNSEKVLKLSKWDYLLMSILTIVYALIALYNLGDTIAPSTTYDVFQGQQLTFVFDENTVPKHLSYYIAPEPEKSFLVEVWENEEWVSKSYLNLESVFTWKMVDLFGGSTKIRLTSNSTNTSIIELVFIDDAGVVVTPKNSSSYQALFDEQELYPSEFSYLNSMYFDEIYHGRTAYEMLNGLLTYEGTHPPLGKEIMALGVKIFGMCPFGWRISGTILGILMVPIIYIFAQRLLKSTMLATFASILLAFDFMHFTQTRIATIDVYVVFFIILMYYFMYRYYQLSFYDTKVEKTYPYLILSGLFMGLGVASKWTGCYAGVGLAVIFFISLVSRYREYLYARNRIGGITNGISHKHIAAVFKNNVLKTFGVCLLSFVVQPIVIYVLSYIPFRDGSNDSIIAKLLHNQRYMFNYHSKLIAEHPFESPWYQWAIMKRPVWYYSKIVTQTSSGGLREGISAFGNPMVWWAGIPALFIILYMWVIKKDKTARFLMIGYLAQLLPWTLVSRCTFMYHYFPCVPFVVLMIAYSFFLLMKKLPKKIVFFMVVLYCVLTVGLFLLFYPVLSGYPVEYSFAERYLKWFESWVLVYGR